MLDFEKIAELSFITLELGEMVMQKLKHRDEVSYVRFASVYREFKDIDTFLEELNGLKDRAPQ